MHGVLQWRIQGAVGAPPCWLIFLKPLFSCKRAYISLCAFAINEDGANKLSSPPSKFLDPPLTCCFLAFYLLCNSYCHIADKCKKMIIKLDTVKTHEQ